MRSSPRTPFPEGTRNEATLTQEVRQYIPSSRKALRALFVSQEEIDLAAEQNNGSSTAVYQCEVEPNELRLDMLDDEPFYLHVLGHENTGISYRKRLALFDFVQLYILLEDCSKYVVTAILHRIRARALSRTLHDVPILSTD